MEHGRPTTAASTSSAPASPPPSRTSCGRRSRGSSRSSTRPTCPAPTSPALIAQARVEVEDAGALIDEILFLSELESGREVVALGPHDGAAGAQRRDRWARRRRGARAASSLHADGDADARRPATPAHAAHRRREPRGERDPVRGTRRDVHAVDRARRRLRRHDRGRRRRRRRRRAALAAALRTLLPRRRGAHDARHGSRPRDREALVVAAGGESRRTEIAVAASRIRATFPG